MRSTILVIGALIACFAVHAAMVQAQTCADACDQAYAACASACKASDTDCFTQCINKKNSCLSRCD